MFWQAKVVLFLQLLIFTILWVYSVLILFRFTITTVKFFAVDWYPKKWVAIIIEIMLTPTDPPVNAIRKILKPVNFGGVSIDFSILIVFTIVRILMQLVLQ